MAALQELINNKKISKDGKDWLTSALDPFHDYRQTPAGFPDANGALSNVMMVNESFTLTAPGATNWDALIFNSGYQDTMKMFMPNVTSNDRVIEWDHADSTIGDIYPVSAFIADTGGELFPNGAAWAPANWASDGVNISYPTPGRVIALGFEVHNTTAEIYRQGTVTVGMLPDNQHYGQMRTEDQNVAPSDAHIINASFHTAPPPNQASAVVYPNAKQWEASRGSYSVCKLSQVEVPVNRDLGTFPVYKMNTESSVSGVVPVCYNQNGSSELLPEYAKRTCFDRSYAMYTGLSPETTLTVTVKAMVEIFPSFNDTAIRWATPSAAYDINALKMYAMCLKYLPSAVPVDMNPSGEYWDMVLNVIKKYGPKALDLYSAVAPILGLGSTVPIAQGAKALFKEKVVGNKVPAKQKFLKPKPK